MINLVLLGFLKADLFVLWDNILNYVYFHKQRKEEWGQCNLKG